MDRVTGRLYMCIRLLNNSVEGNGRNGGVVCVRYVSLGLTLFWTGKDEGEE